jgi:hypothetical protein
LDGRQIPCRSSVNESSKRNYGGSWNSHDSAGELAYFGRVSKSNRQKYLTNVRLRRKDTGRQLAGRASIPRATVASAEEVGEGIQGASEKYVQEERVGVLLLNLGGPETLDDVQPFLYNLFADPVSSIFLDLLKIFSGFSSAHLTKFK